MLIERNKDWRHRLFLQAPLVDAEGFSIPQSSNSFPTIASDISSRNTSDDLDSDFQSLKLNQKLQVNIKHDAVQQEPTEANESLNKMASMLREVRCVWAWIWCGCWG